MFREMRRKKQTMTAADTDAVLRRGTSGVLALAGDGGYPYAVPLSYVYADGKLYFHCATSGHKLDAIQANAKASFCVVDRDRVVPAEYTTRYRSVIAFGRMRILTQEAEKRAAIEALAHKYAPADTSVHRGTYIEKYWPALCMLEMTIEHCTGKESMALKNGD